MNCATVTLLCVWALSFRQKSVTSPGFSAKHHDASMYWAGIALSLPSDSKLKFMRKTNVVASSRIECPQDARHIFQ